MASSTNPNQIQSEPAAQEKKERETVASDKKKKTPSKEFELKNYLLLLASLVATVTYAVGLNLPGGVWQDNQQVRPAGDPILPAEHRGRYLAFYYCNATAFAASLVVCLILLVLEEESTTAAVVLQAIMALDLLSLMGAYAAGSCRDTFTTAFSAVLTSTVVAYVAVGSSTKIFSWCRESANCCKKQAPAPTTKGVPLPPPQGSEEDGRKKDDGNDDDDDDDDGDELREVLMVLATFAATITYVAGLNPPGGFWAEGEGASDPILQDTHRGRYRAFFVGNTTAFVASLIIVILLLDKKLMGKWRFRALYAFIAMALLGLVGAYAAGSCRERDNTVYVLALAVAILAFILLVVIMKDGVASEYFKRISESFNRWRPDKRQAEKTFDLIMLLATLAASITYAAGLDPPGGLWQEDGDGHIAGDPVLLTTHPVRYKVFFYSNSAAFVTSLVVIIMVQSRFLLKRHTLEAAMILDLFGLIGAYAAGSCRDVSTSIYVVALAGAVFVYVVIHVVFFTLDHEPRGDERARLDSRREVLLLLAILAATLTYQAGLTPPGGFWSADDAMEGHRAGFPVLVDNYPARYTAFFYCNAASFMASVALIVLLVNPNLYVPGIRCYALYVCMVAGMFGLMGAYAAGSSRDVRTSIYVLTLVAAIFAVVTLQVFIFWFHSHQRKKAKASKTSGSGTPATNASSGSGQEGGGGGGGGDVGGDKDLREYLMLLGVLAASMTYATGLKPPGGLWQDSRGGHIAGDPVLHDTNKGRYLAFFYTNSTSFMASVVVVILLLPRRPMLNGDKDKDLPLWPMHTAILLDMLGLLGAYAAGSARDWQTSWTVILLVVPVLAYIAVYAAASVLRKNKTKMTNGNGNATKGNPPGSTGNESV